MSRRRAPPSFPPSCLKNGDARECSGKSVEIVEQHPPQGGREETEDQERFKPLRRRRPPRLELWPLPTLVPATIYLTHILVCAILALAVTGLVAVVLAVKVGAEDLGATPENYVPKLGEVASAKNIVIRHHPPHIERPLRGLLDSRNFSIGNKFLHYGTNDGILVWANQAGSTNSSRKRESKIVWGRNWENVCCDLEIDVAGIAIAVILNNRIASEFKVYLSHAAPLLKGGFSNKNIEIRANDRLVPDLDDACNAFHRSSGSRGFSNVALHRLGLLARSFNRFSQLPGLVAVYEQLENGYKQREPYHPPLILRFCLSVLALTFGFGLNIAGWDCFYNQRRLLGATLIGVGLLLGGGSLLFWL